jgi:hypothetical protein
VAQRRQAATRERAAPLVIETPFPAYLEAFWRDEVRIGRALSC